MDKPLYLTIVYVDGKIASDKIFFCSSYSEIAKRTDEIKALDNELVQLGISKTLYIKGFIITEKPLV